MFNHRQNKLMQKREFEARVWRRSEAFGTYMHDIILNNKMLVEESDII